MRWVVLLLGVLLLIVSGATAEVQNCTITRDDKISCPPAVLSQRAEQLESFTGRVTQVLDHRTLEVASRGTTMRVRIRPVEGASKEDLSAIALYQDVIGTIRNIDADGIPIADVALLNGDNLRGALGQRKRQVAEAERKKAQQVAEAEAKAARENAQKQGLQQFIVQAEAEKQARQQAIKDEVAQREQRSLPRDYQEKVDDRFAARARDATQGDIHPLIILVLVVLWYFMPWLIAVQRKHHQRAAIAMLNFLLGWTVLGWIIAMVWAFTAVRHSETH